MSTRLRVLGWRASGLRCPDHEISLAPGSDVPHRVSLIQRPNGVGKTTTLRLLRAALSGESDRGPWDPQRVAAFRKKGSTAADGQFQVVLVHNDRRLTVTMDFDFVEGTVEYST